MIVVDQKRVAATVGEAKRRLRAVGTSVSGRGYAVVAPTGAHGVEVATSLRAKGKEPLETTPQEREAVARTVQRAFARAVNDAARTGTPRRGARQVALMEGARHLVEIVRRAIVSGRLGVNSAGYRRAKAAYQRAHGLTRYGIPSYYGVLTGRFIQSLRATWRSS